MKGKVTSICVVLILALGLVLTGCGGTEEETATRTTVLQDYTLDAPESWAVVDNEYGEDITFDNEEIFLQVWITSKDDYVDGIDLKTYAEGVNIEELLQSAGNVESYEIGGPQASAMESTTVGDDEALYAKATLNNGNIVWIYYVDGTATSTITQYILQAGDDSKEATLLEVMASLKSTGNRVAELMDNENVLKSYYDDYQCTAPASWEKVSDSESDLDIISTLTEAEIIFDFYDKAELAELAEVESVSFDEFILLWSELDGVDYAAVVESTTVGDKSAYVYAEESTENGVSYQNWLYFVELPDGFAEISAFASKSMAEVSETTVKDIISSLKPVENS